MGGAPILREKERRSQLRWADDGVSCGHIESAGPVGRAGLELGEKPGPEQGGKIIFKLVADSRNSVSNSVKSLLRREMPTPGGLASADTSARRRGRCSRQQAGCAVVMAKQKVKG